MLGCVGMAVSPRRRPYATQPKIMLVRTSSRRRALNDQDVFKTKGAQPNIVGQDAFKKKGTQPKNILGQDVFKTRALDKEKQIVRTSSRRAHPCHE
jgi:hypothetical protein